MGRKCLQKGGFAGGGDAGSPGFSLVGIAFAQLKLVPVVPSIPCIAYRSPAHRRLTYVVARPPAPPSPQTHPSKQPPNYTPPHLARMDRAKRWHLRLNIKKGAAQTTKKNNGN